jgi:hypothetical protein
MRKEDTDAAQGNKSNKEPKHQTGLDVLPNLSLRVRISASLASETGNIRDRGLRQMTT